MTAALIIAAWWAVLIFAWAMCRASAISDRRIAHMDSKTPRGTDAGSPRATAGDEAPPPASPASCGRGEGWER